jgi:hypothetical protein
LGGGERVPLIFCTAGQRKHRIAEQYLDRVHQGGELFY